MKNKKFWIVAKFEFIEIVRKPSFWLATLFMPIFLGLVSFVSGYSSVESTESFEKGFGSFETVYIIDNANIVKSESIVEPFKAVSDYDETILEVKNDSKKLLVIFPKDFEKTFKYELIYKKDQEILAGLTMPSVINSLLRQSVLNEIQDPTKIKLLTISPSVTIQSIDDEGNLKVENIGQYVIPVASFVVFFVTVFISSGFLLQSVSAEKENRMIETMLSIIDKRSLMLGKMLGLGGVMVLQLLTWFTLGGGLYLMVQNYFDLALPIDIGNVDFSTLPINLFLIFSAFIFFGAIMTGVGAIGTGAQDSKNLSSVFIILAISPIYVMQLLITNPAGIVSKFFTYFPFTSHMILLLRYSLGSISTFELTLGLIVTTIYSIIAFWIAFKLFELGCLMYNRRPSTKEMLSYLRFRS